ncbi:hypothetical protein FRC17_000210 [Serendipita sp. 399]|nr:hypothetical protein FRC17_000210 [Serendipita sp. 399]
MQDRSDVGRETLLRNTTDPIQNITQGSLCNTSNPAIEVTPASGDKQHPVENDIEEMITNLEVSTVDDFLRQEHITDSLSSIPPNPFQFDDESRFGGEHDALAKGFNDIATFYFKEADQSLLCRMHDRKKVMARANQAYEASTSPCLYLSSHLDDQQERVEDGSERNHISLAHPGVAIEVERSEESNPPWTSNGPEARRMPLSKPQFALLERMHRLIAHTQHLAHPYRYIYCITITGKMMRLWKWSASGIRVSDPFPYMEDIVPLCRFINALQEGGDTKLGSNVGDELLFQPYPTDQAKLRRWAKECAEVIAPERDDWLDVAGRLGAWRFAGLGPNVGRYIILQCPLRATIEILGRGTRYYITMLESDFRSSTFADGESTHKKWRILKTSWQPVGSVDEGVLLAAAKTNPKHDLLATVVGGGVQPSPNKDAPGGFVGDSKGSGCRELRWIMLKNVGRRLTTFSNVREFLGAMKDCINGYKQMASFNLLHGNFTMDSVLIDIETGKGLLVEFDGCKYIRPNPPRNENPFFQGIAIKQGEVGTHRAAEADSMMFSPIALSKSSTPCEWHGYESFFWILVWSAIRHIQELELEWEGRRLPFCGQVDRQMLLDYFFDYDAPTTNGRMEQSASMKRKFLADCALRIEDNKPLETLILELQTGVLKHYELYTAVDLAWSAVAELCKESGQPLPAGITRTPFECRNAADLENFLAALSSASERLSGVGKDNAVTLIKEATKHFEVNRENLISGDMVLDRFSTAYSQSPKGHGALKFEATAGVGRLYSPMF